MRVAHRTRWSLLALVTSTATLTGALVVQSQAAAAPAATLSVAAAIGQQNGATGTVHGYVVGQPTATSTVVRSNFPNDYALALADTAGETNTSRMIYVQITTAFRAQYGLRSHPTGLGTQLDVTGTLGAYFAHPGLTSTTAFAAGGGSTPTDPTDPTQPPTDPGDYYASATGKSGAQLKSALNAIISVQSKLTYDQVWNALKVTDQDPNNANNVILIYSGRSQAKSDNGGGVDQWNREHVWAKSHGDFGTATGPGTDIHHLRPEDVSVNSDRGNKDFDEGGSPVAQAPGSYTDSDSFEPRDAVKGDVARMIFYMAVRYAGTDGWPDLEINDSTSNGTAPYLGKLSVLKAWNDEDPPDSFEQHRNEVIYSQFQHNRNPFVDHPEWVRSIWP